MADIREKILKEYKFDISKENIFDYYKIKNNDITDEQLQEFISSTRKRWEQSINSPNEKIAARSEEKLLKADSYEAVLRNSSLRKKVFEYITSKENTNNIGDKLDFSREYFKLVASTKKLRKNDLDFFFEYYKSERKNKKIILDMLEKEFKVHGIGRVNNTDEDIDEKLDKEAKKIDKSNPIILNFFQKATIVNIRKCLDIYIECQDNKVISTRFPLIRESLYDFLELSKENDFKVFREKIINKTNEVYSLKKEIGNEYIPLVNMFNTLKSLVDYKDVSENFKEFKLLIKYPTLTPYMYAFKEMKPATLNGVYDIANREYFFRSKEDFILNYYDEIYDNFGISNNSISSIIKKAKKSTNKNSIFKYIDEKLGLNKNKRLPFMAELVHFMVYWPLFLAYFIFEVFKVVFTILPKFSLPVSISLFIFNLWYVPYSDTFDSLLIFANIFSKETWYDYIAPVIGGEVHNLFFAFIGTIIVILYAILAYAAIPFCVWVFLSEFTTDLNKQFDWHGLDRTYKNILLLLRNKKEIAYRKKEKPLCKKNLVKIFTNIAIVAIILLIFKVVPLVF